MHKQSKVLQCTATIQNILERNPQIRPSVCSLLSGCVLLGLGLAAFLVPVLKRILTQWSGIVATGMGAIFILGGIIGALLRFPSSPMYRRRSKHKKKIGKTFERSYSHLGCFWKKGDKKNKTCGLSRSSVAVSSRRNSNVESETQHHQTLSHKSLASSELQTSKQEDKLLSAVTDVTTLPKTQPLLPHANILSKQQDNLKKKSYQPNYLQFDNTSLFNQAVIDSLPKREHFKADDLMEKPICSVRVASYVNHSDNTTPPQKRIFNYNATNLEDSTEILTCDEGTKEEEEMKITLLRAKKLFDIYQDPLLHRAITRLKFKCDREFY